MFGVVAPKWLACDSSTLLVKEGLAMEDGLYGLVSPLP